MARCSDDYEIDDVRSLLASGRWERNTRATLKSKRGQMALREIEAALLALPEPKLAYETFHRVKTEVSNGVETQTVECCVLGALARHKGVADDIPEWVTGHPEDDEPGNPDDQAHWAEQNLGLRFTLAWNLIYENDNMAAASETDERRFERVLAFVRKHIKPEPVASPSSTAEEQS